MNVTAAIKQTFQKYNKAVTTWIYGGEVQYKV